MSRHSPKGMAELHHQPVVVVTDVGLPISVGRLLVSTNPVTAAVFRVELEFETERLKCILRLSPEKWPALIKNWDGDKTRYVLPHGNGFWIDEREKQKRDVVDTFLRHGPASAPQTRTRRRRPPN